MILGFTFAGFLSVILLLEISELHQPDGFLFSLLFIGPIKELFKKALIFFIFHI